MSEKNITFTCKVVETEKRWECTDGTKSWLAGESYRYNGKLASEAEPTEPPVIIIPPKTVNADQTGVDGNKIYKIVKITGGKNPEFAVDGKKSTASEGKELIADLGGIAYVRTFAIKFDGGPYSFEIKVSLNSMDYIRIPLGLLTADISTPEDSFHYFILPDIVPANWIKIESQQDMKVVTLQLLEIDPDPAGAPVPEQPPVVIPPDEVSEEIPIPTGFKLKGPVLLQKYKHWGRHTTGYSSGGSGPRERWDLSDLPNALNVLSGYEFNLGTKHGERGDDNTDLKFRGPNHSDSNAGWYISFIEWLVSGKPAPAGVGKEFPHPKTSHLDFNVQGKDVKVNNIKDGNWHGFLSACYNDEKGVPTIPLWYNEKATGKMEDYVLLGISKDTGNMEPGPVCDKIGMKGSKLQRLQIRMDEVPDSKIRNAFAVEIETPKN